MIATAQREMIPQLMELWRDCFGDPMSYISFYFTTRFRPEETLVALENGRPVAMLTLLPMTLQWGKERCKGRYVYAVGTAESHRGKGLSTQLLSQAKGHTLSLGGRFCLLVPARSSLFAFYEKRGYQTAFWQTWQELDFSLNRGQAFLEVCPAKLSEQRELRDRHFGERGLYGGWGAQMLCYVQQELEVCGGSVVCFDGGYGVASVSGEVLVLKELVSTRHPPQEAAQAVANHLGYSKVRMRVHPAAGNEDPYAMLCWCERPWELAGADKRGAYFGLGLD